ncbi:hypothetical protein CA267_015295 [Alteromonas pelagimontana]|uniref:Porin n=1 Tax=Alteromonas pelagimontana TaxID=1858656 RepID=A0A6M4MFS0_9ALTE|nr:hypothetical protein [Alteromonas pelagimontana]QJR82021.1 hypothetical protein CA267_015295 [Alteromonas pelagimontana]
MAKCFVLLFLLTAGAAASPQFEVSGYGTLGVVKTDSGVFGYRADYSKTGGVFADELDFGESSNLGVQLDILATDKLDFVVQGIYRDQENFTLDSALNLAFVRYTPEPNWSFRAGRTAFDLFLVTEYRDINFAYPWAHVPNEIYGIFPHRFLDGVDVSYRRPLTDEITVSAKFFYGSTESVLTAYSSKNVEPLKFDDVFGVAIDFSAMSWDIAFNSTQVKFDSTIVQPLIEGMELLEQLPGSEFIWPNALQLAHYLDLDNRKGKYTSISGQYRFDKVTVMSEMAKVSSDSLTIRNVYSGYVSAIYHVSNHNFFATLAFADTKPFNLEKQNIDTVALAQIPGADMLYEGAEFLLNYYNHNQKTLSVGWRWDFVENMSLKMQWDHTRISKDGSTFWQPADPSNYCSCNSGHVNTLFTNVSFLF